MREVQWINGKRVGKCKEWYEDGSKKLVGYWKDGIKDGKWIYWNENGIKIKEEIHKDGKMEIEKWY